MTTKFERDDHILGQVQAQATLGSREAAVTAVRAVLTTLAERIGLELGHQLATQLPREIGMFLEASDATEQFDARELVRRVGEREGIAWPEAAQHARIVLAVVGAAISAGGLAKLRDSLPADYEPLLPPGASARSAQSEPSRPPGGASRGPR